jgi:iron-sulfur cluster assembly accessory protein
MTDTDSKPHDGRGIELTPAAIAAAFKLKSENKTYETLPLRLYIEGKGCDGFYYGVTFDSPQEKDYHFTQDKVELVVDPDTLQYCEGSKIDWVDDERGTGFLVDNPKHRQFRGKFYKRKTWQEKLLKDKEAASSP